MGNLNLAAELGRMENEKYDREMMRRRLSKLLDEDKTAAAVESKYKLTAIEKNILRELEYQRETQKKFDEAFAEGFGGGGL